MTNYIAYKFRLKPTNDQRFKLASYGGACRWIWNQFLTKNKEQYALNQTFLSYEEMANLLPAMKDQEETKWLNEMPSQALQQRLKDLRKAIVSVYRSGFGFPKYKSRRDQNDSFKLPQGIKTSKKSIFLPKIGWMNWIRHRPITGRLKETIIKQEGQNWFAICVCEITPMSPIEECSIDEVLGIDLGLESLLICSDNTIYNNPRTYRKYQTKLRRQSQILSRRKKGSANRNKARQKLTKIHTKIRQVRNDHLHKITSAITKRCKVVGMENLNIKGLIRTRLAKSIHDASWGYIKSMLEYKMKYQGGEVRYIDRFYASTQICSFCGNRRKIPLSERIYTCDFCGSSISRDLNAALNIKQQAIYRTGIVRIHACEDISGGETDRCKSNQNQLCVAEAGKIQGISLEANHFNGW